jgi:glycosyltransferase involved in cell wall biosynthesis
VKTYGIYVAYPPWTQLEGEGLGRYLAAFVRGASQSGQARFVIACPGWTRPGLESLFKKSGVPDDAVEFLAPRGVPGVIRLASRRRRKDGVQAPPRTRIKRRRWSGLRHTVAAALGRLVTSRQVLLLLVVSVLVSVATLPLLLVGGLLGLAGKGLSRVLKRPLRSTRDGLSSAKRRFRRGLEKLSMSRAMYEAELQMVHRLIDGRSDVTAWYCPTAFWPSFNRIRGPRVLCVPDFVVSLAPVAFAHLGGEAFRGTIEKIEQTIRGGDHFITYSEHVKHDTLVKRFGTAAGKVTVVPHGANTLDNVLQAAAKGGSVEEVSARLLAKALTKAEAIDGRLPVVSGHSLGPYLFYASQLRPHKNVGTLLKAFRWLLDEEHLSHRLVMTCSPSMSPKIQQLVSQLHLHDDVLFLVRLSEEELAACYHQADLAVNPTLSEGACPFTFTEALSVDTPVVMSRIEVPEEVITDRQLQSAMLFDPYDWRDMARVIRQGVERRDELLALQQEAYRSLARRTWREVSHDTISALDAAAGEGVSEPRLRRRPA